jgi:hypothetical protein
MCASCQVETLRLPSGLQQSFQFFQVLMLGVYVVCLGWGEPNNTHVHMQSPAHVLHATLLVGLVGVGEGGHTILLHLRT